MKTTRHFLTPIDRTYAQTGAMLLIWLASLGLTPAMAAPPSPVLPGPNPDSLALDSQNSEADGALEIEAIRTDPIDHGFVIVSGNMLQSPFVLDWRDASLFINDVEIAPLHMGFGWGAPGRTAWEARGEQVIAHMERELRFDGLVIGFTHGPTRVFDASMGREILVILAADTTADAKVDSLMGLGIDHLGSWQWRTLVASLRIPDSFVAPRAGLPPGSGGSGVNPHATASFNGTLSLLGFALAVMGLGFTVAHSPHNWRWRGYNPCPSAIRTVKLSISLLVVLNAYDLMATLSMRQAGGFMEANPLAAMLLDSSRQVIVFKAATLLFGLIILYMAKRQRIAQIAVWWVSLAYTVLLIRWAAITSLLTISAVS